MKPKAVIWPFLFIASVWAAPLEAEPQHPKANGKWHYADESGPGQDVLDRAIDDATQGMNFVKRAVAKRILHRRNPFDAQVSIQLDGRPGEAADRGQVVMGDGRVAFDGPLGHWQERDLNGATMQVNLTREGGAWLMVARDDDTERRTVFSVQGDGRLRIDVQLTTARLEPPLRFTLEYRRQP